MHEATFPTLLDGNQDEWSCAGMPLISAVSPSGLLLAYARVENSAAGTPHQHHQPTSPKLEDSSSSHFENNQSVPGLSRHGVVIARSTPAAAASSSLGGGRGGGGGGGGGRGGKVSENKLPSTSEVDVNTCPLNAPVTALQWLDESHLACGLLDGTVTIIAHRSEQGSRWLSGLDGSGDEPWTPTLSRCFHRVSGGGGGGEGQDGSRGVRCIRVSGEGTADGDAKAGGGMGGSETLTLWVLYVDHVLVCVGVEALVALARQQPPRENSSSAGPDYPTGDEDKYESHQQPPSPGPSFAKLQLEGQDEVLDVVACPAPAGLFEVRSDRHSHVILAAGVSPALAFYPIGSETRSFGLASIAWAVASRVTSLTVGAIDGIFGLVGLRGRGRRAAAAAKAKLRKAGGGGNDDGDSREESPAPLVLRLDGELRDGRRRVTQLCLDPSGRLAAAADGFGRVMLVDCATRQILRMWKGVRDAECGWVEVVESWEGRRVSTAGQNRLPAHKSLGGTAARAEGAATPVIGLYLAILAPLRGRVELWRMRHGPCVRMVPAPAGARLVTSRPSVVGGDGGGGNENGKGGGPVDVGELTRCYLLSGEGGVGRAETRLRLSPLSVEEADLVDLPRRLSREPAMDDDYRLLKFFAAVVEMRLNGSSTITKRVEGVAGERGRLPAGQEAREELLLHLMSQLESLESLVQAMASFGGQHDHGRAGAVAGESAAPVVDGAVVLSASFQRRASALCRDRAEQATTVAQSVQSGPEDAGVRPELKAAVAELRFRAAAYELYTLLEAVELQPAGTGGGDEDEDPAFLPPGKRGWKHALLCEEVAGWADLMREGGGSRGTRLLCAELPDFQEFLDTVSNVLELSCEAFPQSTSGVSGNRQNQPSLLRFRAGAGELRGSQESRAAQSRRASRDSASSHDSSHAWGSSVDAHRGAEQERCRGRLVGWLFRPLLSDAFAMASLRQALSLLGLGDKAKTVALVRDMAAWFLALPVGRAADITVGREAQNCPVLRWLKGVVLLAASSRPSSSKSSPGAWQREGAGGGDGKDFLGGGKAVAHGARESRGRCRAKNDVFGEPTGEDERYAVGEDSSSDSGSEVSDGVVDEESEDQEENDDGDGGRLQADPQELLRPMYEACVESESLENAAMLSVVAAEAIWACREKLEESSLGQIAIGGGEAWAVLARRLRLCLFVDHRLRGGGLAGRRDRTTVGSFQEGKASVYALVAKDQLLSFRDLGCAACSTRENAEVVASVRSQREAAEARAAVGARTNSEVVTRTVAAAPTLTDARMDEHWRAVQTVATCAGKKSPAKPALSGIVPPPQSPRPSFKIDAGRGKASQESRSSGAAASESRLLIDAEEATTAEAREASPTTLFFMRSHAQPIVLACHRTRWLVLAWSSAGPSSAAAVVSAAEPALITEAARAAESAVHHLSLAVDHLSYLRTVKPFLAGCVAYWLWEHGGLRSHVGELARGLVGAPRGEGGSGEVDGADDAGGAKRALAEEGRPAREAFLAAAEEFLKVEALFSGRRGETGGRARRGVGGGGGDRGGADVSFMSLLSEGAMQRCPWPGAWDRWVEECLRDAQVHTPLQPAVANHTTLLRALRVNAVCRLPEGETLQLFEQGRNLCAEGSLRDQLLVSPATPGAGVRGGREAYIRRALEAIVPRPAQNVYRLAQDFGVPEDTVRGWHCLVLIRRGHDVLGEEAMSQVFSLQDLAGDILTVMRLRLKRVLGFLETSPGVSGSLLASLDADTCQWVRSARDLAAVGGARKEARSGKEAGEPLRSTHGVLLCLARALPRESRYKRQANALVVLVGTMLRQLDGGEVFFGR